MYEEDEEEEYEDIENDEEGHKIDDRKKYIFYVSIIISVLSLIVIGLNLYKYSIDHMDDTEEVDKPIIDVSLIPTPRIADQVFGDAWEDSYGLSYEEFLTTYTVNDGEQILIPNTNTRLPANAVVGETASMALMHMAYQKNPFMITEDSPEGFQYLDDEMYQEILTLPTGDTINLRTIEQVYTDVKTFVDTHNPLKYEFRGYVDGAYFEEVVDLTPMYRLYANQ